MSDDDAKNYDVGQQEVKSQEFCSFVFLRVVGSCFCWLRGLLAEGVARSEQTPQAAAAGAPVTVFSNSSMFR